MKSKTITFSPMRFRISGRLSTCLKCFSISPRTFRLTAIERLFGRDVGDALSGRTGCVNSKVGSEDDESLGEIDAVAASGGQDAVVQNLQKFVENPRMGLFDFVEQNDAEGLFPDGIGEFASHVVSDVAGGAPINR